MIKAIAYLLLLMLFAQCQKDEPITTPESSIEAAAYSQQFELQVNEQAQLPGTGSTGKLFLKLQRLNDSRCPANAMCVHYGSATAVLQLTDNKDLNKNVELCIGACPGSPMRDTHTVTEQIGDKTYKITLKAVQPFPGLEATDEPKKAVLVIDR